MVKMTRFKFRIYVWRKPVKTHLVFYEKIMSGFHHVLMSKPDKIMVSSVEYKQRNFLPKRSVYDILNNQYEEIQRKLLERSTTFDCSVFACL